MDTEETVIASEGEIQEIPPLRDLLHHGTEGFPPVWRDGTQLDSESHFDFEPRQEGANLQQTSKTAEGGNACSHCRTWQPLTADRQVGQAGAQPHQAHAEEEKKTKRERNER